jgi:hypothetical protein
LGSIWINDLNVSRVFVGHHGVPPISIVLLVVAFYARQTRRTKPLGLTEAQAPTQYLAAEGCAGPSKAHPFQGQRANPSFVRTIFNSRCLPYAHLTVKHFARAAFTTTYRLNYTRTQKTKLSLTLSKKTRRELLAKRYHEQMLMCGHFALRVKLQGVATP